eukprot:1365507-Rhodomonas_salina.1
MRSTPSTRLPPCRAAAPSHQSQWRFEAPVNGGLKRPLMAVWRPANGSLKARVRGVEEVGGVVCCAESHASNRIPGAGVTRSTKVCVFCVSWWRPELSEP